MLTRRRLLAIAAAAALPVRAAAEVVWEGIALGAEARITLRGDRTAAESALAAARATLARMERLFSLYRPDSELVRLNGTGQLARPSPDMLQLLALCGRVHGATGGGFDPTIQPLWRLLAESGPAGPDDAALAAAQARVGWEGVRLGRDGVWLRPGMALSLNGIAQGYATDVVGAVLAAHGFTETLVDAGEILAGDGTWRVGVADPVLGVFATRSLGRAALATSSPGALDLGSALHILHPRDPRRAPRWSTVSVEASTAAVADAYATGLCFAGLDEIRAVAATEPAIRRVLLVDEAGNIRSL